MSLEGCAAHPVGYNRPLQIVTAVCLKFELSELGLGANGSLARFKQKERQTAITVCSGQPHLTRSIGRIVCRGQESPKVSKDT